jgi:predicted porin
MKKTLIALAAVAVSGAAFAQATVTGAISWGYQATEAGNGFGTDTAKLVFATSEDLGGGLKVSGSLAIDNTQDGGTNEFANAKGATLSLAGGFGTLTGSTVEGGDAVSLDSLLALGNGTKGSTITYAAPAMSGLSLSVSHKSAGPLGVGNSDTPDSLMIYGVKYATGPFAAGVSFLRWNDDAQSKGIKSRDTITASYDAGVAKVGVFYSSQKNKTASSNLKNTAYQLSVPMGAVSLGAEYGVASPATGADLKGTSISASYALSKRTSISVSAKKWDKSSTVKSEDNSILLNHSF